MTGVQTCALPISEDYIIPEAFDPRVKNAVSKAVAKAVQDSGVARI